MATETSSTCQEPQSTNNTTSQSQTPLATEPHPQPLPNLPHEIVVEILLRLPVKSLLRLSCVCKSWRSLISNPKFAKTHLSLASSSTDHYTNRRLLLSNKNPSDGIKSCSLYSFLNNNKYDAAIQLDNCPLERPYRQVKIWGACDGLVCIGTEREVCIWNPSTGKCKKFPDFKTGYNGYSWFGMGYDECIDDYKVVGFFFHERTFGFEPEVKVHTLRSDSWRRIEGCTDRVPRCASGTFVKGALHWLHWPGYGGASNASIFSLDLEKETFGEVLEPEYRRRDAFHDFSLGVLNGCLSMLCNYNDAGFDVWVMKEYGIRDSWTKLVVTYPLCRPDCLYSASLCKLENGEILLDLATRLVRYDPKDGTFSYLDVFRCYPRFGVCSYTESLVSPDFDVDNGRG